MQLTFDEEMMINLSIKQVMSTCWAEWSKQCCCRMNPGRMRHNVIPVLHKVSHVQKTSAEAAGEVG